MNFLEKIQNVGRLVISFSGGRTSAMMTKLLLDKFREKLPICVLFANTGKEDEKTLEFVNECDHRFDFGVIWLEAKVYHDQRKRSGFKIVNFQTAARDARPFEDVIKKYGLPGPHRLHCTRELKTNPMQSFIADQMKWRKKHYVTAIGLRADEVDRIPISPNGELCYPLIDLAIKKSDVLSFWSKQSFDLQLPEHYGNCTTCWKKSKRKLMTIALEKPQEFDFFRRMENEHSYTGAGTERGRRFLFRGRETVDELFRQSTQPFERFVDGYQPSPNNDIDVGSACGDSCEIEVDS